MEIIRAAILARKIHESIRKQLPSDFRRREAFLSCHYFVVFENVCNFHENVFLSKTS